MNEPLNAQIALCFAFPERKPGSEGGGKIHATAKPPPDCNRRKA